MDVSIIHHPEKSSCCSKSYDKPMALSTLFQPLSLVIQLGRGVGNEAEGGSSCVLTLASRPVMKVEIEE